MRLPKRLGLAALCATGTLLLVGHAGAAIMQATFIGTLTGGADTTGIFGQAGGDLSGQAYSSTYEFNTALGEFVPLGADAVLGYVQVGGAGTSSPLFPSPVLNASVTIAGVAVSIDPVLGGDFGGAGLTGYPVFDVDALAGSNHFRSWVGNIHFGVLNNDPTHTFSGSGSGPGSGLSTFAYASGTSAFSAMGTAASVLVICLRDCPAAVPEPATWALMLSGFIGLGAALRRRRTLAKA